MSSFSTAYTISIISFATPLIVIGIVACVCLPICIMDKIRIRRELRAEEEAAISYSTNPTYGLPSESRSYRMPSVSISDDEEPWSPPKDRLLAHRLSQPTGLPYPIVPLMPMPSSAAWNDGLLNTQPTAPPVPLQPNEDDDDPPPPYPGLPEEMDTFPCNPEFSQYK